MAQKKSFKADLNPAMQFISTPAEETATGAGEGVASTKDAPEGYKVNPLYIEKRSKRLQLLVQPSLYDKVKAQAETEGCSVNDYIHRVLEEALRGE
jgi:hypothetical protein